MKPTSFKDWSDDNDFDHTINDIVEKTQKFIKKLKYELTQKEYKAIAKILITEFVESID